MPWASRMCWSQKSSESVRDNCAGDEFLLTATAQNLRRMAQWLGTEADTKTAIDHAPEFTAAATPPNCIVKFVTKIMSTNQLAMTKVA